MPSKKITKSKIKKQNLNADFDLPKFYEMGVNNWLANELDILYMIFKNDDYDGALSFAYENNWFAMTKKGKEWFFSLNLLNPASVEIFIIKKIAENKFVMLLLNPLEKNYTLFDSEKPYYTEKEIDMYLDLFKEHENFNGWTPIKEIFPRFIDWKIFINRLVEKYYGSEKYKTNDKTIKNIYEYKKSINDKSN